MEYLRICDAFGKGYFFLPGTETCLKIGGRVRTEGAWSDPYRPHSSDFGTLWHTRAELNMDTATDTEYGALKTNAIFRWDWQEGGTTTTRLLWANISLGGFTVGKLDSQYSLYMGYAGNVYNDDPIFYGPKELNQLTYKYDAGNGFTAIVSLEDNNSASDVTAYDGAWTRAEAGHYLPDVVAGAGFKASNWQVRLIGGYDSIVEQGGIKARADADFGVLQAFVMAGYNTDGKTLNKYAGSTLGGGDAACPNNGADCGWGDWATWAGVGVPMGPKLTGNAQVAYSDSKIFAATANVQWKPVADLLLMPEVSYTHWEAASTGQWAGLMRFERKF